MSRSQIGLRLAHHEAESLRAAARARRMSLGELVTTLLRESRADAGRGLWLELDPPVSAALRAVAAAEGRAPEALLDSLVRRWLSADLARMQRELFAPTAPTPAEPEDDEPGEDDEPDAVLFTVSED
jgi:hypothetical protein